MTGHPARQHKEALVYLSSQFKMTQSTKVGGRHEQLELEAASHFASRITERGMLVLSSLSPLYPVSDLSSWDGRWIQLHQ